MKNSKMRMLKMINRNWIWRMIAVLGMAVILSGCDPVYDHVVLTVISDPPVDGMVNSASIELTSGVVVMVKTRLLDDDGDEFSSGDSVQFVSQNSSVFKMKNGAEEREFALLAVSPGQTILEVQVDGKVKDRLDVVITEYSGF